MVLLLRIVQFSSDDAPSYGMLTHQYWISCTLCSCDQSKCWFHYSGRYGSTTDKVFLLIENFSNYQNLNLQNYFQWAEFFKHQKLPECVAEIHFCTVLLWYTRITGFFLVIGEIFDNCNNNWNLFANLPHFFSWLLTVYSVWYSQLMLLTTILVVNWFPIIFCAVHEIVLR